MSRRDLIFSDKLSFRIIRQAIFWFVFIAAFSAQNFDPSDAGFFSEKSFFDLLIGIVCFFPCSIFMVYTFLNILYPAFLSKEKYFSFITGVVVVISVGIVLNYFAANLNYYIMFNHSITDRQKLFVGYSFLWWDIGAATGALALKFVKNHYLQELENAGLALEKAKNESRLMQAPLQYKLIFHTLNWIQKNIEYGSRQAPYLLLRLSEVLSYLLYESNEKVITLQKELEGVIAFLALSGRELLSNNLEIKIPENAGDIIVPPNILFHLFHNLIIRSMRLEENIISEILVSTHNGSVRLNIIPFKRKQVDGFWEEFIETESAEINLLFKECSNNGKCIESVLVWEFDFPLINKIKSKLVEV